MKKLKLLPKTFLYTFGLVSVVLLFAHSLLYFSLPTFYLAQKNNEAQERLTQLVQLFEKKEKEQILQAAQKYALTYNTNIDLSVAGQTYYFQGYTPVSIQLDDAFSRRSETKVIDQSDLFGHSLILAQQSFTNSQGLDFQIQLMLNVQPVDEAKQIVFKLLPYTFSLGLVVALIAAYFYSRMLTTPIKKILEVTKQMEQLTPDAHNLVASEDELGLLAENINDLYDTLWHTIDSLENQIMLIETLEKEKIEFLRGASHELKTPLTSLSILLENMQLKIGKYQDRDHYLLEAQHLTQSLAEMIHQILESTYLQAASLQNKQTINVKEVFYEVAQAYTIIARSKHFVFETNLASDCLVFIDQKQLEKLFSNLLSNAIAYTPNGQKIQVDLSNGVFTIRNETPEMAPFVLDQLFQPFYRPDFSRNKKDGGTGLGLYFVKTILDSNHLPYRLDWQAGFFIFEIDFSNKNAHETSVL